MSGIPDPASSFEKASGETATPRDPETGRFLDGVGGRSRRGRKVGSRVKLGEKFFTALQADFEEHGVDAIARVRFTRPDVYFSVIAKLMPQKLEISTPMEGLSDERFAELLEIAERYADAARQAQGDNAKPVTVIEAKALAAPPPMPDAPLTEAAQRAEAQRRDLNDQHDALGYTEGVKQALSTSYPVGKPHPTPDHVVERRNRAKLDDINPEDLF